MQLELFRSLFPRWNFFDQISQQLKLEFKPVGIASWQAAGFEATRAPFSLLVNPAVTLLHAELNLLGDFVAALNTMIGPDGLVSSQDVEKLTSFRMIRSLVFARLKEFETNATEFQFRISADKKNGRDIVFVSDILVG